MQTNSSRMHKKKDRSNFFAYLEGSLSIFINVLLFGLKYRVGMMTASIAIIADAWHTLSASITSVVVLISAKATKKPADKEHPFGHGRAEPVASIIVGILLAILGFNFLTESIAKLFKHESARFGSLAVVIFVISVILQQGIARFSFWAAGKTNSPTLRADGWHHQRDAVVSFIILAGLFLGEYFWWIDGVLGVIVTLLILYTAYDILKKAINPLLGETADERMVTRIKKISECITPGSINIHHVHFHRYGQHKELTFHILLDGAMSLTEAHSIANTIENAIRDELRIEATIHVEPWESEIQIKRRDR